MRRITCQTPNCGVVTRWSPAYGPVNGHVCGRCDQRAFKLDPQTRTATKHHRTRDMQRARLYLWEHHHVDPLNAGVTLTLAEATVLAHRACHLYGLGSMPRVEAKHHGHATGGTGRIALPGWALKPTVVLHEAAHTISAWLIGANTEPGHGRTYARIALTLYEWHFGAAAKGLRASMREYGLKLAPPGPTAPLTATEFAKWEKQVAEIGALLKRIEQAKATRDGLLSALGARRQAAKSRAITSTTNRRAAARRQFVKEGATV